MRAALVLLFITLSVPAFGDPTPDPEPSPSESPTPPNPTTHEISLAKGTSIQVQVFEEFKLNGSSLGKRVKVRVVTPVSAGGCVVIPVGSKLKGDVIEGEGDGDDVPNRVAFEDLISPDGENRVELTASLQSTEWGNPLSSDLTIRQGDEAVVQLERDLELETPDDCAPSVTELPEIGGFPDLPVQTMTSPDGKPHDPINLILQGTREQLAEAFARSGWDEADGIDLVSGIREFFAVIFGLPYLHGPMSDEYLYGREQDFSLQREGQNARRRHHVRFWLADEEKQVWVGAGIFDNGVLVDPGHFQITHSIDPDVDKERDLIARELAASGCATLDGFHTLPGAPLKGTNGSGEAFFQDGRATVLTLKDCE